MYTDLHANRHTNIHTYEHAYTRSPFPAVWHTEADNLSALDVDTVEDLALILRASVAELYNLSP